MCKNLHDRYFFWFLIFPLFSYLYFFTKKNTVPMWEGGLCDESWYFSSMKIHCIRGVVVSWCYLKVELSSSSIQECLEVITTVWSQTWFVSDETKLKRGFGRIITVPQPLADHWTMSEAVIRTLPNTCSMAIGFSAPAVLLYRSVPVGLHYSLI